MAPPALLGGNKQNSDWGWSVDCLASRLQLAVLRINTKNYHGARILIRCDQILAGWVKGEIPGSFSLCGHHLNFGQSTLGRIDRVHRDAVGPAVGGVKKTAASINLDLC